jgi:hypothetical protein
MSLRLETFDIDFCQLTPYGQLYSNNGRAPVARVPAHARAAPARSNVRSAPECTGATVVKSQFVQHPATSRAGVIRSNNRSIRANTR